MTERRKQIHLAAHFPGVNNHTVWGDPRSGSQIDFASFEHLARAAERGKFDYFFLAEGLRLREQRGRIYDLDVVGRPDAITVLAALSSVTEHLGLGATVNATFNEPYELARQFATLELLSGGRSAWNIVTSSDAFTGENFRRGGYLPYGERYERAGEFVRVATELWASWADDAVVADPATGAFVRPDGVREVAFHGRHLDVVGELGLPRSPQLRPVLIQAGDSSDGREFGAATADVIFSRHTSLKAGQAFYADVKGRLAAYGRRPAELKIMPGATFVLGDTEADAVERARFIRGQQVTPQSAIAQLEQVWGCDLSDYDADGPLPAIDPDPDGGVVQGRVALHDRMATATKWRELAEAKGLTIRQLVMEVGGRVAFVGSAAQVAAQIDDNVQRDAADGYILVPHLTPSGLDEFVDQVVPLLQERGVFRHEYTATTLRGHLGLGADRGAVTV